MTPGEIVWRMRSAARGFVDRYLLGLRSRRALRQVVGRGGVERAGGFAVTELGIANWIGAGASDWQRAAAQRLRARADRIAAGRLRLFDLEDHEVGRLIDWNQDPKHGVHVPPRYAPTVDYRDFRVAGDAKFVWEPNRHHQLVVLGRAYRATGNVGYASAAVRQWQQWLAQCPFGMGMNWRSPLELAIRLINWVWTLELIRPSGVLTPAFQQELLASAYLHMWDISRKYSRGSSANNHRIGEAAGVYVASCYFRDMKNTDRWRAASRRILCEDILAQTFPDGGTREQAIGYHCFVLQFFLVAGVIARQTGDDFPPTYWARLRELCEFLGTLGEGGENLPMFGDCDDGYVLDLDADPHDIRPWLAVAAVLLEDPKLKTWSGGRAEGIHWLVGAARAARYDALANLPRDRRLVSRAFPDSGYYLLQCGRCDSLERISAVFDCGPLGFRTIAAHGHADALSFTLRAFGVDVLVDPGTYDYFTYPPWRDYFRSTRAHNTVAVDDVNQSEILGPFLWGAQAQARCLEWDPSEQGGRVCGEHNGYSRLPSPVLHRRSVELDGTRREVHVQDDLTAEGRHEIAVYFHLAERCRIVGRDGNRFEIDAGAGRVTLELDGNLEVEALHGSEQPIGGWVSRGYHRKTPSTTLVGRCTHSGPLCLRSRILIGRPVSPAVEGDRETARAAPQP